jgi:hypothetical protein
MKDINWRKVGFRVFLLLLVVGGVSLLYLGARFLGHGAEGIGEALIIAGVLALTVDSYVKEHLLKEASQDIAKYLVGYQLPPEIQGTIKDLMSTNLVSRDLHLHYELSLPEQSPGNVLAEVTLTYRVDNISNKKRSYKQYVYQQSTFSPTFLELRCDSNDEHGKYHLGVRELSLQLKGQEGEFLAEVSAPEIQLRPNCQTGKFRYQFTAKFKLLFPEDYGDFFVFDDPTIGVVMTAEYPDEIDFVGPSDPDNINRWEYARVFFGGEQITVQWRKKR